MGHFVTTAVHRTAIKPGVVKLALSDPQGVCEAFQGVYDIVGPKGVGGGNESSLNLGDNVN